MPTRCNGGVNTALKFDKNGELRFAALQSDAGRTLLQRSGRNPDDISSIVLVEESGSFIKSEAILRIAKYLQIPFPVLAQLALPLPTFIRDGVYDQVPHIFMNAATHAC
jgi:predicted DCC family thiol-disulfide oxidoreductase YuxK